VIGIRAPLPIAIFLSGGGRTLENLIQHRDRQGLPVDIRVVISSSARVRGVDVARDAGIETHIVLKSHFADDDAYCHAMFDPVRAAGATHVVMAGFLKHVLVPDDFAGRVINIHPSLLPAFGGPGMYGDRVHTAAIARRVQVSGCTVHKVDNQYDNGPIVLQRWCPVSPTDTPQTLAVKVFDLECEALPAALRQVAEQP
jgi:phosphoribosylglycinamide formyltransferase-1